VASSVVVGRQSDTQNAPKKSRKDATAVAAGQRKGTKIMSLSLKLDAALNDLLQEGTQEWDSLQSIECQDIAASLLAHAAKALNHALDEDLRSYAPKVERLRKQFRILD
jgi:hypothetical protein